jgi:CBS domain-containing protein
MSGFRRYRRCVCLKEVMTHQMEAVHLESILWEAAQKMAKLDIGPLSVCNGEQLVGMLTDRDIIVWATAEGRDPKPRIPMRPTSS